MRRIVVAGLVALVWSAGCGPHRPAAVATPAAPKYPSVVQPDVPASLTAVPAVRQRFDQAWARFQAGDTRAAARDLSDLLKQTPSFYPAEAALGDFALVDKDFKSALVYFSSAAEKDDRYLPALEGRVQAALGLGDDLVTASALEQLLRADPTREEARSRLDLIRLRLVQTQLTAATRARSAGRLDEAQSIIERALQASPSSPVLLRELAAIETSRGVFDAAEEHARRAVELDGADPESLAMLGAVLEIEGRTGDALDAYKRAVAIDPRAAWRERVDVLGARARLEALPADYRDIPKAPTATRAQVAAMIGIDLEPLVTHAPRKSVVVTDVRTHWAASWILPVTQAGIMDVFPNHTFQPNAAIRRGDLAQVVSHLLDLAAVKPDEMAKWRAARPALADVTAGYVSYRAIALAVASGAMTVDEAGRFWPARPASGADLVAAIARVKQLGPRQSPSQAR